MFGNHLSSAFQPFPPAQDADMEEQSKIQEFLDVPCQMTLPIKAISASEIKLALRDIKKNKAPGYDLITGKLLQELPDKGIALITQVFNAMLRLTYWPIIWKILQEEFSKDIIPDHQFGFRVAHSTIQQVHRVVNVIASTLEEKVHCSAAFLDVTAAFDKVWHTGLLFKTKSLLPQPYYLLLKSYLSDRFFRVKHNHSYSYYHPIQASVPQGSVLGPFLYVLYTQDLPRTEGTVIATFADDTAILSKHHDPTTASNNLQLYLNELQKWLNTWRIHVNESKSVHMTVTTKVATCPPVALNNQLIPQNDNVRYLGIHLDRKLTWKQHIEKKKVQLKLKHSKMFWLMGSKSKVSIQTVQNGSQTGLDVWN
ncbi:hypothetical protein M8J77_007001 [Diaphorina citri]|nr:hypothetical protein M8J77_007001 [Diaphorina citri]